MIDWQERVFQVLTDPDSAEIDAAMTQLFGALHDRDSAWHTQAVQVLRQLYEHFSFPGKSWDARSWYDDMAVIDEESEHFAEGW